MHEVINLELVKLTSWFHANRLSINVKKTNFIIFKPRQKSQIFDSFALKLCDTNIDCVREVVFLSVILDEHLSWKSHIAYLATKVSRQYSQV